METIDPTTGPDSSPLSIQDWIDCLRFPEEFQGEALEQLAARWDEAAQPLLGAFRASLTNADSEDVENETLDEIPFQAAYLFAQFRYQPAFPELVRLLQHPLCDELLGDILLDGMPRCLASCWTGDAQPLLDAVRNTELGDGSRAAAWSALLCLTAWNERPVEALVDDLRGLLEDAHELESGFVVGAVAISATQIPLDPETVELARAAFEGEIVDLDSFSLEEFDGDLKFFDAGNWRDHLAQLHGEKVLAASEEVESWFIESSEEDADEVDELDYGEIDSREAAWVETDSVDPDEERDRDKHA